jgi:hypothetical protein
MHRLQRWKPDCKRVLQRLLATRSQRVSRHHLSSHVEEPPLANLYDDLQDGEIRLFEFDITTTGDIAGRFQTVQISSAPPFYALSYVCGRDACSEEITINGRAVLLRPNLFEALKELWSHFVGGHIAQLAIWIDAICIDQGNEDEKAKQIRKMHSVFSGAVEVLVWLGHVGHHIQMVLRIFAWIDLSRNLEPAIDAFRQHGSEPGYLDSIGQPTLDTIHSLNLLETCLQELHGVSYKNLCAMDCFLIALRSLLDGEPDQFCKGLRVARDMPTIGAGLFPPNHAFWVTLYSLLRVEWFGRTWTFQELRLAQEAKLFVRGGACVPWGVVAHSMDVLFDALMCPETLLETSLGASPFLPPLDERADTRLNWLQFNPVMSTSTGELYILPTLIMTKNRVSTIAKDQVYGLIALWPSKAQEEIIIDYTISTGEVFANAVKTGLKMDEWWTIVHLWTAFDGFDRPLRTSITPTLPSWCPDFQYSFYTPRDVGYESLSQAVTNRISALACYEHTSDFETINIRILKLDTITNRMTAPCPPTHYQAKKRYLALLAWLQELLEVIPSEDRTNRSLRCDMQTLLYERTGHAPGLTFDHFSQSLARLACVSSWQLADVIQDSSVGLTLETLSHQYGRYFFLTRSGRIGYSARQPCLEGHIVLVPGDDPLNPLHMLTADCTQYAGCASVLGLMGDSLLESLDDMETKWEMVCLR